MSGFRLNRGEDGDEGIRRVAHERARDAVERLRDEEADPVKAVHEARKDVKKLRATLRLVRPRIGEKTYQRENDRFRDAGRTLSDARDAQVRTATLDALAERFSDDPPPGGWGPLRARLLGDEPSPTGLDDARAEAAAALEAGDAAIEDWRLPGHDFGLLRPGMLRAYARGRKSLRAARADPSDEKLHDWRKRAKDFWYHLRLVREAWPAVLGAAAAEAHELSDLLGDDHDLVVLCGELDSEPSVLSSAQLEHLSKLIAKRRDELQQQAFAYGERLYAEKPKQYVARIERHWNSREL